MDERKEVNSSEVIIQNFDPNTMDPQELATLLEQTGGASDEGCVQIVDGDGNLITITASQLAAAGIDLTNINESDVETLLQLANQGDPSSSSVNTSSALMNSSTDSTINCTSSVGRKREAPTDSFDEIASKLPKMASASGSNGVDVDSTVLSGQLALNGTLADITELDQETLASLMQNGAVKFVDEHGNEIPASAILSSGDGGQSIVIEEAANNAPDLELISVNENSSQDAQSSNQNKSVEEAKRSGEKSQVDAASEETVTSGYALIGALVDVKRNQGPLQQAIVRYVRPGVGYKVQFQADNRFEWVSEGDILPRTLDDETDENAFDPTSQHNLSSPSSAGKSGSQSSTVTTYAGRRSTAAGASSSSQPQQKLLSSKNVATSAAVAAVKKSLHFAGATCSSADSSATDPSDDTNPTNFICPVCEKKIYNKQPSYIVIRLPACDTCAESKILVLDDDKRP